MGELRPVGAPTPLASPIALSVGYVALYLTLDRLSFIGALHGVGITPWNPSTGVAMALLIIKGVRYAPLVMAAELISGAALPSRDPLGDAVFLGSLVVTAGYTGAAAILRHAGFQAGIRRSSDVVSFLIVTIISSGLVASGFVATYAVAGVVPWSGFAEAGFHFWIGDAIGIVVFVPPLLLLYERIKERALRIHGRASLQFVEVAAQGGEYCRGTRGGVFGDRWRSSSRAFLPAVSAADLDRDASWCAGGESGRCWRSRSA